MSAQSPQPRSPPKDLAEPPGRRYAESGHITQDRRAGLADAVLDLPEVQESAHLSVVFPSATARHRSDSGNAAWTSAPAQPDTARSWRQTSRPAVPLPARRSTIEVAAHQR